MRPARIESDISVVLNAHAEGSLARYSLRSAIEACRHASERGITSEIVAILDRPTARTREFFRHGATGVTRIVETDFGDLGLARNEGVRASRGRYVAFLDADDLWSSNWLTEAHLSSGRATRPIVYHPELSLYFSPSGSWLHVHVDQESPEFEAFTLLCENYWTALSFAPRELYLEQPYARSHLSMGFGYEDWHWNCEVIAAGYTHKIVSATVHFVRVKTDGLLATTNVLQCVPRPSSLFSRARISTVTFDADLHEH